MLNPLVITTNSFKDPLLSDSTIIRANRGSTGNVTSFLPIAVKLPSAVTAWSSSKSL